MSNLLLDEYPLVIIPSLAKEIGLNESIILQQLHYWLEKSTNEKDGYKWVYNTYKDWVEQFPFWSESTVRRAITKLESEGYIITGNYNKMKIDKTKWYRIDYKKVQGMNSPSVQNEQSSCSKWTVEGVNLNTPITRDYTETNTEKKIYYSAYVKMYEKEYKKLVEQYGESITNQMIETLDAYKGAKGKKYKDDYRAILMWVRDKVLKEQKPTKQQEVEYLF